MSVRKTMKYVFWGWKGNYLANKRRFEKALKIYNEMIEMDPAKPRPYRDKLFCLMGFKRYDEALNCVDQLLKIEPDNADNYYVKGSILSSNNYKQHEEAIAYFDQAIALKEGHAPAYLEKGIALMNLNRDEEALECFNRAIALVPNKAYLAYCHKAMVMNKRGEYDQAVALCDKALTMDMSKTFKKDMANLIKEEALKQI